MKNYEVIAKEWENGRGFRCESTIDNLQEECTVTEYLDAMLMEEVDDLRNRCDDIQIVIRCDGEEVDSMWVSNYNG